MVDSRGEWKPLWVRGGKIDQVVWIGKDILGWCSGLYIVFFNITQKRESLRWCSKDENADGVCCLSGHLTMPILAFSDKAFANSKIRIFSYPSMDKVSECIGGSKSGYLATAFTPADSMISLGSYPTYSLTIWAWRTGERLFSIATSIRDLEDQIIQVNYSKPVLIAQLGQISGKLHIWEMSLAGKTIILTNHEITLPKKAMAYHMAWSSESGEPLIAVVDKMGHIYISNYDGSNVYRIVLTQRCGICLEHEPPAVCWFRGGIVLRTTFCQIRFFKKDQKNFWRKEWYVKSVLKPRILSVHPSKNDRLFYHTQEGYLMELEIIDGQNTPTIERRMHYGGIYSFADLVRPWGHHVVAIDDPLEVAVLDSYDGKQVARLDLDLEGEVIQILSHPDLPMTAITSKEGELAILSLRDPENPFVIGKFRLQRERLDLIKFSQSGNNLVVGQRTSGICYCISLTRNKPFAVIAKVKTECRMADVIFYDHGGYLKLLVIVVSSRRVPVGRHLAVYELQPSRKDHIEPTSYLELPYAYQFLHWAPEGLHTLIGTAYLSRQIHLLEIKDWKQVNLVEVMGSVHQVRRAKLYTDRHWIASAAFDGLITLRSGKTRKIVASLATHHKKDLGVVKAVAQPSGNIVVSLGHNGSLVGMKFHEQDKSTSAQIFEDYCRINFDEYESKKMEIFTDYTSLEPGIIEMLSKKIEGFPPVKEGVNKTWVEWSEEAKLLAEAEECSEPKQSVQDDFVKLQKKVITLLDENEACPDIEKLPISVFDLDKTARDQRLKAAREEIEDTQLELDYNCMSMERITRWMKTTFWDAQKIVGQSIFSLFGNTEVTNYSDDGDTPDVEDMLRLARLYWNSDTNPPDEDSSKLYTRSKLHQSLPKQPKFNSTDERQRIEALLGDDDGEEHEMDPLEIEDQLAKEGMTTYRFVEPSNNYCSQFDGYTFSQLLLDNQNITIDVQRLREYFNELFIEMLAVKERAMNMIEEKYKRIQYIDSELMLIFGQSPVLILVNPDWNYKEKPNNIVKVLDDEVTVEPYVSNSQQELRNKQAIEAERLRQILLADDFREKALIRMMDGVLEVRWEDVIKIDIAKPPCMLFKDPEEYNAEDLLAVRQYEKDVDNLNEERLRYRRLLEAEFAKIREAVKEVKDKFNKKLGDFSLVKMRVQSAIQQLNLRILRSWLRYMYRMKCMREDDEILARIAEKQKMLTKLGEEIRLLQGLAQEYRNQYETLITKERIVDKKFRSDFPGLRRIFVEMLEKEYKRRPRIVLKNVTAIDLVELGRNLASHNKASYLAHECFEYLKHMEILDVRPAGLSQTVESHHWDHLIRMRRNRIELEMKLKAQMAHVHETEKTITEYNEKMDKCNEDIDSLKKQLNKNKQDRIDFDFDVEIQLIVKMGQVEVQPSGRRNDMANAILLPQREIDAVNAMIMNAGKNKLTTMNHTINFRRRILFKQWEHECRKMTIVDHSEELSMIENLLVTRDIREYLKRLSKGYKDDKSPQQLQKEMEKMKKSCEKRLEEWLLRLEDIENKSKKIKRGNEKMDKKIEMMNVDRWELEWQRDLDGQSKQKEYHDRRMAVVVTRSKLVRMLQKEYTELLAMQTEHELLRLRRFPTLDCFKTLDDEKKKKNAS